jgi:transcriptional regulator with XRE-family HTH domain
VEHDTGIAHVEDQVISQTDVVQRVSEAGLRPRGTADFARQLERLRDERGWSKADLAKKAELDPSSITRFEQGARNPDRDTVLQLAEAMALPLVERDRLLAAAGYRSEVWDDPLLVEISHLLADRDMPDEVRDEVRAVLKMAVAYARLKRFEPL